MKAIVYEAFGDASTGEAGTVYGLILVPENAVADLIGDIERIKRRYGADPSAPLHCREMLNARARERSPWAHLTAEQALKLLGDVLTALEPYEPIFVAGIMLPDRYPTAFRLKGKDGHDDITHPVTDKWRELWVFKHAVCMLQPQAAIPVTDPRLVPSPPNMPWWRFHVRAVQPGYTVSKIYLDRETTKVSWFSKQFQWAVIARDMVVVGDYGESHLPIMLAERDSKHPMLEVADIFAWNLCRALGNQAIALQAPMYAVQTVNLHSYKGEIVLG